MNTLHQKYLLEVALSDQPNTRCQVVEVTGFVPDFFIEDNKAISTFYINYIVLFYYVLLNYKIFSIQLFLLKVNSKLNHTHLP